MHSAGENWAVLLHEILVAKRVIDACASSSVSSTFWTLNELVRYTLNRWPLYRYSPIECLFVTFYITCSIFTIASNFCNYVYIATYLLTCLYNSLYTYKEHREVGVGHDSAPLCRPRFTAMNRKWPRPRVGTHLPIGRGREPRLPATQQTCGRVDRLAVHRGYP